MSFIQTPLLPARSRVPFGPSQHPLTRGATHVPIDAGPRGNRLLAALPDADWQRWLPHLEHVEMPLGQVLYESGSTIRHLHFPTTSIVSLFNLTADGACAEVAAVGNDGAVGAPLLMGGGSTNGCAVVQTAGQGYRLKGSVAIDDFGKGGAVMQLLLHYLQALLTQIAQSATCNRRHTVDEQACRLILLNLDRVQGNVLHLTQEQLASRLGVRRESITAVALALQRAGLIRYARGRVEVLDREGLEDRACECYGVVKRECERLLPPASTRPIN